MLHGPECIYAWCWEVWLRLARSTKLLPLSVLQHAVFCSEEAEAVCVKSGHRLRYCMHLEWLRLQRKHLVGMMRKQGACTSSQVSSALAC